jgi:hypothetical protein
MHRGNDEARHCERSEAIQRSMQAAPGLLRRFAPRNDECVMPALVAGTPIHSATPCRRNRDRRDKPGDDTRSLPDLIRQSMRRFSMDHRVKPGGDSEEGGPSCPHLLRASTSCLGGSKDVDGRDKPGHDGARVLCGITDLFCRLPLQHPRDAQVLVDRGPMDAHRHDLVIGAFC